MHCHQWNTVLFADQARSEASHGRKHQVGPAMGGHPSLDCRGILTRGTSGIAMCNFGAFDDFEKARMGEHLIKVISCQRHEIDSSPDAGFFKDSRCNKRHRVAMLHEKPAQPDEGQDVARGAMG